MFILLLLLPHLFHVWIWISSLIPLCPFNLFIQVQTWRRQRAHTRTHTHTNIYIYVCVYIYTHKFEGFFYYFGLISSSSSLTLNWSLHVLISIYSEPFFVAENHSESGGVANNGGAFNDTGTQMQKSKSIRQNRPINRFSINDQIGSKKWSLPVGHRWNKSQQGSKQIYMYANEPPPPHSAPSPGEYLNWLQRSKWWQLFVSEMESKRNDLLLVTDWLRMVCD